MDKIWSERTDLPLERHHQLDNLVKNVLILNLDQSGLVPLKSTRVWTHLGGLHQVLDVEQSMVDPEDDPVKQSTVQRLGHGVSHRTGLKEENAKMLLSFSSLQTVSHWGADYTGQKCLFFSATSSGKIWPRCIHALQKPNKQ